MCAALERATVTILVPAFNEVDFLPTTLARLLAAPSLGLTKEIVVVDDGSTDGTGEYLRRLEATWRDELPGVATRLGLGDATRSVATTRLRTLFHDRNRGKGAAIRTAIAAATGAVCVVQDADLEYDPAELERLIRPILRGRADAVFGSRFVGEGARRVLYFRHAIGNRLLTFLSNLLTDLNLTDMETGYKAFRTDVLRNVFLVSNRFGFEAEVTAKLAKLGARIYEVPISYQGRTYDEGKKVSWRDGIAALWHIFRFNILPETYCHDAGHETLRNLGAINRFNRHLYETLAPFLGHRVLEVGAGIGSLTVHLARGRHVLATDIDAGYLHQLRERFRDRVGVTVAYWDINQPFPYGTRSMEAALDTPPVRTDAQPLFDTVVCLNVLEHVEADQVALQHMCAALEPLGRLVLLVPAHPWLFSELDSEVGHVRRYARADLEALLERSGFQLERLFPFNAWGLLGWWLNGRLLHRNRLPGMQLSLFGRLAGMLTWMERRAHLPLGLSHIAIAVPAPSPTLIPSGPTPSSPGTSEAAVPAVLEEARRLANASPGGDHQRTTLT